MSTPVPSQATPEEIAQYQNWWATLSKPWKQAFNEITIRKSSDKDLPIEILHQIWTAPALRFTGPSAPFPNMSFVLDNLDGVLALKKLEIFVFTFQALRDLKDLKHLPQIKSLFVFNNQIQSLNGIEDLINLQELYVQVNQVDSIKPVEKLTELHTLYCCDNLLTSLEGVGEQHLKLETFFCLPNPALPRGEALRVEREFGIQCRKL